MTIEFEVAADFPQPAVYPPAAGLWPELALATDKSRFYRPDGTLPELYMRWIIFAGLALRLVTKAAQSKEGKCASRSEVDILDQYCLRAIKIEWGSNLDTRRASRRVSALIGWPVQPFALPVLSSNEGAHDDG
jgi:hypothetical protein